MTLSNTTSTYGSVTRAFHWLTALLVMTLIPVALIAHDLPHDTSAQLARKAFMFSLHKTLGVTVFFIALARIIWAMTQPKPAPLHPDRKAETLLAETAHWLLYGSLVLAPLSGWIHHASTSGFAPIWWPFGQNLPLVPKSAAIEALSGGLHEVFGKVMLVTILLHIAGALKHHVIDRDATLARMWRGATAPDAPTTDHPTRMPLLTAIAIWAVTLTGAGLLGLYAPHTTNTPTAELAEVTSDWTVQEGSINIAVTQFGSTVAGGFADWTADISYDPTITSGPSGAVEVVIATNSLTLGSVTDQATGPDFFDTGTFDTATFRADLITDIDGFTADGTLTIKDQTLPLVMPFRLSVQEDTANMSSNLTLDRRDFGIGANMDDESALAFAVEVSIELTATRSTPE